MGRRGRAWRYHPSPLHGKRWTQMPNCGRYSSSSSICLLGRHFRQVVWGALQLPLGLSRGSVTVPYLAAVSGQKPIPFDSPLKPRNYIYFAPFFSYCPEHSKVFSSAIHSFWPFRENDDFRPDCLLPHPNSSLLLIIVCITGNKEQNFLSKLNLLILIHYLTKSQEFMLICSEKQPSPMFIGLWTGKSI